MYGTRKIHRGEIYYCELGVGWGSEQAHCRPVVICQCESGNRYSGTTIIVPLSSSKKKKALPTHVHLAANGSLEHDSVILCEQIRVVDRSRLREFVSSLGRAKMSEVDAAISIGLGLTAAKSQKEKQYEAY